MMSVIRRKRELALLSLIVFILIIVNSLMQTGKIQGQHLEEVANLQNILDSNRVAFNSKTEKDKAVEQSVKPIDLVGGEVPVLDRLKNVDYETFKVAGKTRNQTGYVTIAVPTVKRPIIGSLYLMQTLDSLIRNSSPEDKAQIVVVIYLADNDQDYNSALLQNLTAKYSQYLQDGFMNVIKAPTNLYPSFENLKRNFGDSEDRVKWRSREVIDSGYMYHQCMNLSSYFIQLEDDVLSAPSYLSSIKKFVRQNQNETWAILDLTSHGSTGKLMRSSDLQKMAVFMFTFFEEQPVDFLMNHFRRTLAQKDNLASEPIIFQHMGGRSSFGVKGTRYLPEVKSHFHQTWIT